MGERKTTKARVAGSVRPAMQQRSREKRDRLIRAGIATFASAGYEQARVADIAREAGISVGVFYQRFKDKRGFFDALEAEFLERGKRNWDAFFDQADPNWSAEVFLQRLMTAVGRTIYRNMGFFRGLITLGHHDKSVVNPAVELDLYGARKLEAYLVERKLIDPQRLRDNQVYFALAAAMKTMLVMAANDVGPFRATDESTARELSRMVAGYLEIPLN